MPTTREPRTWSRVSPMPDERQGGQERFRRDLEPGSVLARGPLAQVPGLLRPTITVQPDILDTTFVADCGSCTGFVDSSGRMFIGVTSTPWGAEIACDAALSPRSDVDGRRGRWRPTGAGVKRCRRSTDFPRRTSPSATFLSRGRPARVSHPWMVRASPPTRLRVLSHTKRVPSPSTRTTSTSPPPAPRPRSPTRERARSRARRTAKSPAMGRGRHRRRHDPTPQEPCGACAQCAGYGQTTPTGTADDLAHCCSSPESDGS
jgi:hypothetical protein